jgi:hypothetical protein
MAPRDFLFLSAAEQAATKTARVLVLILLDAAERAGLIFPSNKMNLGERARRFVLGRRASPASEAQGEADQCEPS